MTNNANDRLKIISQLDKTMREWETLPHETHDHSYYEALYQMSKTQQAIIRNTNKYLDK